MISFIIKAQNQIKNKMVKKLREDTIKIKIDIKIRLGEDNMLVYTYVQNSLDEKFWSLGGIGELVKIYPTKEEIKDLRLRRIDLKQIEKRNNTLKKFKQVIDKETAHIRQMGM